MSYRIRGQFIAMNLSRVFQNKPSNVISVHKKETDSEGEECIAPALINTKNMNDWERADVLEMQIEQNKKKSVVNASIKNEVDNEAYESN
jgi:TusA-related sulfurtransferase